MIVFIHGKLDSRFKKLSNRMTEVSSVAALTDETQGMSILGQLLMQDNKTTFIIFMEDINGLKQLEIENSVIIREV